MGRRLQLLLVVGLGLGLLAACATGTSPASDGGPDATPGEQIDGGGLGPDAATCPAAPCSLLEQCGCGGVQVCDLDPDNLATGGTACRDVTVPGDEGSGCESDPECGAGLSCFGAPGGQCRRYCDAELDCGAGGHCTVQVTSGGNPIPGVVLCTKACTPEAASGNGCPAAPQYGCRVYLDDPDAVPDSGDEYFMTDCSKAGSGGHNTDCTSAGDAACLPGYACYSLVGGGNNVCRQICQLSPGPGVCDGGRTCQALSGDQPTIAGVVYGVCQ